jgi:hypothetical protein
VGYTTQRRTQVLVPGLRRTFIADSCSMTWAKLNRGATIFSLAMQQETALEPQGADSLDVIDDNRAVCEVTSKL